MRSRPQCLGSWDEGLWADCPTISQHSQAPAPIQTQLAKPPARSERCSAGLEEREQSEFPVPSPREGHTDMPPPSLLPLAGKARQSPVSMATTGSPVPASCLQSWVLKLPSCDCFCCTTKLSPASDPAPTPNGALFSKVGGPETPPWKFQRMPRICRDWREG